MNTTMNNEHSALIDIAKLRSNRSLKIASKTGKQIVDELFPGQDVRVELDYYDSPICCPDRICQTYEIDHDFRPDFRNTRISIDVIPQILRAKSDVIN